MISLDAVKNKNTAEVIILKNKIRLIESEIKVENKVN